MVWTQLPGFGSEELDKLFEPVKECSQFVSEVPHASGGAMRRPSARIPAKFEEREPCQSRAFSSSRSPCGR